MDKIIIDVREEDEFSKEHIPASLNIPLSRFSREAPSLLAHFAGKDILLMCRSGKRAQLARQEVAGLTNVSVFEGGILEWKKSNPVVTQGSTQRLPIMRQVQLCAGTLVLAGVLLAYFVDPNFIFMSAIIGAGLIFAGISGFCGMALLLAKMPWNKR